MLYSSNHKHYRLPTPTIRTLAWNTPNGQQDATLNTLETKE